ncbi:MBL fold metallo-hydrolase [Halarchaeum sp. P4]|uniref:MBL fold metallo-hydrolase n=1 Tax=Halarchaeum sp. P4 TaxID=3421639 RepID=UPI003EC0C6BC
MVAIRRVPVPVDAPVPTGTTNSYVAGDALVDPAARTARLDDLVAEADVAHIVCTHTHPDHVGAVAHYAEATDATVWAHAPHAERFERATGVAPDRMFRESASVGPLDVVATPGHAPDHVAFACDDAYLVGDLARADGSVAIGADGDMRAYLTSLRRLYTRDPDRLYPGHGAPIDRPRERLAALLAHRREREARVLQAVDTGAATLDEVVDAAYDADLTDVREHATATVAAHLDKLAVEGRVARAWRDAR